MREEPVRLIDYDLAWPARFEAERSQLEEVLRPSDLAAKYDALKRDLAARHRYDREAYTDAKSEFVKSVLLGAGP